MKKLLIKGGCVVIGVARKRVELYLEHPEIAVADYQRLTKGINYLKGELARV